ncbi:MAG: PAS domain-containing protein [Opitutaceae bacterium]|nr:PAS domain-containing protein [Opitutaceae bacterium]
MFGPDEIIQACNPAAVRIFGFSGPEALVGRRLGSLVRAPGESGAKTVRPKPLLGDAGPARVGARTEMTGVRAHGVEFPCEFTVVRLESAEGEAYGAFVRDISDLRRAEAELRKTSADLEQEVKQRTAELTHAVRAFERAQRVSQTGSIELDLLTAEHTKWSQEMYALLEFDPAHGTPTLEAFLGRIHPDDRGRAAHVIDEAWRGRGWEPYDFRVVRSDGSIRWMRGAAHFFTSAVTAHPMLSAALQDITERKTIELELERLMQRLSRAQEVARMGFVDIDRRQHRREWSREMFALFGFSWSPEPPSVEEMLQRVHPDDRDRVRAIIDRSYATGELAGTIEYRLLLPDGTTRWIRNIAEHESGDNDRIMSIYLDITDLKLAQEAEAHRASELAAAVRHLDRTRRRLERAQALARMGDAERDIGTRHRVWSRELFLLHGLDPDREPPTREEFLARLHPEDHGKMAESLREADGGADIPSFEYRVILPSGETRWLRVHSQTTTDPESGVVRVASSTFDITEQKAVEQEMHRLLERERELGRLKADFLHMVTHEYRTPLGIIVSAADILERYRDRLSPDEWRERIRDIRSGALRLAGLMEEVLFLGKAEAGTVPLELHPIDFGALVRDVVREVVATFGSERDIEISVRDVPSGAQADEKLLRHILGNLVSNALKYSKLDQPVRVSVDLEGGHVRLVVRDEGIGIPEADQPRIFEMFRRASNVGTISGTGLGLVVVKRCVELHGGSIGLRSAPGRGTEVTVLIPINLPAPPRP